MSPKETIVMQFQSLFVYLLYPFTTSESTCLLQLTLAERQTLQIYLIFIMLLHKTWPRSCMQFQNLLFWPARYLQLGHSITLNSEKVAASWSISSSCLVTPHLLLSQVKVAVDCKSASEGGLEGKLQMCYSSPIIFYSKNKAVENLVSLMLLFTRLRFCKLIFSILWEY